MCGVGSMVRTQKAKQLKPGRVVAWGIPYQGTADYGDTFNHSKFFDWASAQNNPVFISEYKINDDRFFLLKEFTHRTTFSSGGLKNTPVTERLYGNKIAYDIIQKARAIK